MPACVHEMDLVENRRCIYKDRRGAQYTRMISRGAQARGGPPMECGV